MLALTQQEALWQRELSGVELEPCSGTLHAAPVRASAEDSEAEKLHLTGIVTDMNEQRAEN